MLETQLVFFKLLKLLLDILVVLTNPQNLGVETFNCLVINDRLIERHMKLNHFFYNGCTDLYTIFSCNAPDHLKWLNTIFIDPQTWV